MIAFISVVVMLVGLGVYGYASNAKVAECGRIAYFSGLLTTLLQVGSASIGLFK